MLKNKRLPVFGVGPIYVICCFVFTVIGISLRHKTFLKKGKLPNLKNIAVILGVFCIIIGVILWVCAVPIQKINEEIKNDKLVTRGVYSIVRNPVYSAFLMIFTGALIMAHNIYLLLLPIVFYFSLTVLMKMTEEKWLLKKFGNDYQKYCNKVNRIIPWWRK